MVSGPIPLVRLLCLTALNLPFALCSPESPVITDPFWRSLAINAVLFLLPGLPLSVIVARWHGTGPPALLLVIGLSLAALVGIVVGTFVAGFHVSAGWTWNCLWATTNLGAVLSGWVGAAPAWRLRWPQRPAMVGGLLFIVAYPVFYVGAVRVVPATADHDYELQGTVHSLVTSLVPRLFTTRGTTHYFAHPPLAHVYVAGSFLGYDRWRELAIYDPAPGPEPPNTEAQFAHYLKKPFRLETRTPNIFLAALTVARLGSWAAGAGAGFGLAWLLSLAYISCPEVFVRSSYGGYFAIGNFVLMELARAVEDRAGGSPQARLLCALAGGFAALADHKLMVVVAGLAVWEALRTRGSSPLQSVAAALRHPAVVGFGIGTACFWTYGLVVSAESFWNDHVRHHLLDRITHRQIWNVEELGAYPGITALWYEFERDTGWLLLPLAVASLLVLGRKRGVWNGTTGFWLAWILVTAGVFSVVDWRQTKHLVILTLPLYLATARAAAEWKTRLPIAMTLTLLIIWNLRVLVGLSADFGSLVKAPEW